jgi:hypothetical protein
MAAMTGTRTATGRDAAADCARGRHRPNRSQPRQSDGIRRGTCRDCGCALMQTLATRHWFYAGLIAC